MLESALTAGLTSQGVDVLLIGVIPTPGLAFLTRTEGFNAGAMISASHNPAEYNGIKFFSHDGFKLTDQEELQIERSLSEYEKTRFPRLSHRDLGTAECDRILSTKYFEHLQKIEKISLSGLRIVLDLANGATYSVAPRLLSSLGADIVTISDKPDGMNINSNCGSTHLENLQKAVLNHQAHLGLAFDGDGDRLLAVDENGQAVDGDQILLITALELARNGKLRNNLLVTTIMSNYGLEEALEQNHIALKRTNVGDKLVVGEMIRSGAVLGGEQSGHIVFLDYNTTGDGLITAVKLLATLKRSGGKLSALAAGMKHYPQVQINVKVNKTENWNRTSEAQTAISNAEREIKGNGRIVVRASGTEPVIRIMVEGKDVALINKIAKELADSIRTKGENQ
jgi:phosphoglucosamine mutase